MTTRTRLTELLLLILALTGAAAMTIGAEVSHVQRFAALGLTTLMLVWYVGSAENEIYRFLPGLTRNSGMRQALPLLVLWVAVSAYGLFSSQIDLPDSLLLLLFLVLPYALLRYASHQNPSRSLSLPVAAAVLSIWLPIEFGLLPKITAPPDTAIPITSLAAILAAFYLFLVVYRLDRVGYTFRLSNQDWSRAAVYFAVFLTFFATPLGILTGFVSSSGDVSPPATWPLRLVAIFLFIAIPEELLFRGVIQNLLARRFSGKWTALGLSSILFGLAHANNPVPPFWKVSIPGLGGFELPWVYLVLATVAGVFYGLAYIHSGKITTAALVHCLVDGWWSIFYQNGY